MYVPEEGVCARAVCARCVCVVCVCVHVRAFARDDGEDEPRLTFSCPNSAFSSFEDIAFS